MEIYISINKFLHFIFNSIEDLKLQFSKVHQNVHLNWKLHVGKGKHSLKNVVSTSHLFTLCYGNYA